MAHFPGVRSIALAAAIAAGIGAALKLYPDKVPCPPCPPAPSWWGFGCAATALFFACVAGALKLEQGREADKTTAETKGPSSLIGCLHALHGAVLGAKGIGANNEALRVTVHKVISETQIMQLTPYVGGKGGGPGRKLGKYGVVGLAILRGQPQGMCRVGKSVKNYRAELTARWFVPEEVAASMREDRMSFFAVPLRDAKDLVVGAIFFDARRADFFDDSTVNCVLNSCAGIAKFLQQTSGGRPS